MGGYLKSRENIRGSVHTVESVAPEADLRVLSQPCRCVQVLTRFVALCARLCALWGPLLGRAGYGSPVSGPQAQQGFALFMERLKEPEQLPSG